MTVLLDEWTDPQYGHLQLIRSDEGSTSCTELFLNGGTIETDEIEIKCLYRRVEQLVKEKDLAMQFLRMA